MRIMPGATREGNPPGRSRGRASVAILVSALTHPVRIA